MLLCYAAVKNKVEICKRILDDVSSVFLTSPILECKITSMLEEISMSLAWALKWTPFGAFILSERVGDSNLKQKNSALLQLFCLYRFLIIMIINKTYE